MQSRFRSCLKINVWGELLNSANDVSVEIVIGLEPDLHGASREVVCLIHQPVERLQDSQRAIAVELLPLPLQPFGDIHPPSPDFPDKRGLRHKPASAKAPGNTPS